MRIALAQVDCRLGNIPANVATHKAALKTVSERGGADILLFPELSLTGYRLRSNIHRVMMNAEQFADVWQDISITLPECEYCVLGYIELTERAVLHNATALMNMGNTTPKLLHRKVYLPTYGMFEEARYTRAGDRFRTADIIVDGEKWRVGILCCEDAWHNSAWAIMQARGVDLVIVNSASPGRGVEAEHLGSQRSWYNILATQAEMTGCWVAYCNRVGFEDDIHFWGGSAIFSPTGEIAGEAALLEPDVLIATLDKNAITHARLMTPLGADERWELTIRELDDALAESLEE